MVLFRKFWGDRRDAAPEAAAAPDSDASSPLVDALGRWERVVQLHPDRLEARLRVIDLLRELGRDGEAPPHIEQALHHHPEAKSALVVAARHRVRSGDADALGSWSDIERRWPDDPEAVGTVGDLLTDLGRFDEALERVETLRALDAERASQLRLRVLMRAGRDAEAIELLTGFAEERALEAHEMVWLARMVDANGEPGRALEIALAGLEDHPAHARLILMAVRLLEREGRHDEAFARLEEAGLCAVSREAQVRRVGLLISMERFDEADSACRTSLEEHPDDVELLTLHARSAQAKFALQRAA